MMHGQFPRGCEGCLIVQPTCVTTGTIEMDPWRPPCRCREAVDTHTIHTEPLDVPRAEPAPRNRHEKRAMRAQSARMRRARSII